MFKKIKNNILFLTIIPEVIWHLLHNRFDDDMFSKYARWVLNTVCEDDKNE